MSNRKDILTVTLNPAVDKMLKVRNFKVGKEFRAQDDYLSAGGKGINVSRTLKILGMRSLVTGFIGGLTGEKIKESLRTEKIPFDFEEIKGTCRVNLTILDPRVQSITRVLEKGPAISSREKDRFQKRFKSLLKDCRYVIFSGIPAPGLPVSIYADLISVTHPMNCKSILDTSGPYLKLGLKAKPFLVKPNLEEAQEILGKKLNSVVRLKEAIKYFKDRGVSIVIITMGRQGALISREGECWRALPPQTISLNQVGCGDSFLAGFMYSYIRGESLPEALRFATAAGAANALTINPGLLHRDILLKLVKQVRIKKV